MITIGLDMMGGDFAPLEAVKGAAAFFADNSEHLQLVLIGKEEEIKNVISLHFLPENLYSITHASQVIEMHEHPTKALKEKPQSSIAIGFQLLATGKIDAFISAAQASNGRPT